MAYLAACLGPSRPKCGAARWGLGTYGAFSPTAAFGRNQIVATTGSVVSR